MTGNMVKIMIEMCYPYKLDTRSLIEVRGSLLVTLPISWVRHNALTKGEKVSVALDDIGQLVIAPTKRENESMISEIVSTSTPIMGEHQRPEGRDANESGI